MKEKFFILPPSTVYADLMDEMPRLKYPRQKIGVIEGNDSAICKVIDTTNCIVRMVPLTPIETYRYEFDLRFPVIPSEKVVYFLKQNVMGKKLQFRFKGIENKNYFNIYNALIVNLTISLKWFGINAQVQMIPDKLWILFVKKELDKCKI